MVQAVLLKSSLKQTQPPLLAVPASVLSTSQGSDRLAARQSIPEASQDQDQSVSGTEESSQQAAAATQDLGGAANFNLRELDGQAAQSNSVLLTDFNLVSLPGVRQGPPADAASRAGKKDRASAKSETEQISPKRATVNVLGRGESSANEAASTANNTIIPQAADNPTVAVPESSGLVAADHSLTSSAEAVHERRETANQQAVNALIAGDRDPHQAPVNGEFSAMAAVADASPTDSTDHLAFALQVAPLQGDHAGSDPQNGILKATTAAATAGAGAGSAHAAPLFTAISQTGFSASAPQAREARSTGSPEPAASASDVHFEPKTAPGDPLRVLRVQFAGSNDQRVDVRVADAGGQLRVSVRSSEPGLTQALQDHVPELTSRLSEQSFHASVWMPPASSGAASGSRSAMTFSVNVNPEGQGQQGRREKEQNHPKPEWIDDLERNPLRTPIRRS
jgi:hypothetical protein